MSISADQVLENDTYTFQFEVEGNPIPGWILLNNFTSTFVNVSQGIGNFTVGPLKANCSDTAVYVLQAYNTAKSLSPDVKSCNLTVLCTYIFPVILLNNDLSKQ